MEILRLPIEELSADYEDIIIGSVTSHIDFTLRVNGVTILNEIYYPDTAGTIYIRNIGMQAMDYQDLEEITLQNGTDGSCVVADLQIREGESIFETAVTIYRCDAETGDTLAVDTLKRSPLSRTKRKVTAPGRTEYLSFYGAGEVSADVIYCGTDTDESRTISLGSAGSDAEKYYRLDVSPAVIADLLGIPDTDLISYAIYKMDMDAIRYTMDIRGHLHNRTFLFRNIFGATETFTCTGDETSERSWEREYGILAGRSVQTDRKLTNTYTVNTGYIFRDQVEVLEDLLNSDEIYLLDQGKLFRISVLEETFKLTSRRDELISAEFKYRYSSRNQLQLRAARKRIFDYTFDKTFN